MTPRADSGVTLLLFGLFFTLELLILAGLFALGARVQAWLRGRILIQKAELTARCDALQARYDPAGVDYDDDLMGVADAVQEPTPHLLGTDDHCGMCRWVRLAREQAAGMCRWTVEDDAEAERAFWFEVQP